MARALLAQHYGRLNTTTGYVAYILDMWHMLCCQCVDRGNGTNLCILLCPCPNASHCMGALSCPFCRSDLRSLQHLNSVFNRWCHRPQEAPIYGCLGKCPKICLK